MKRLLLAVLMLPMVALAAGDDYKVIKLEQDVRKLEAQVRDLSRQLAELRREPVTLSAPAERESPVSATSQWLQLKNWQRLQAGMQELQVIEILGPPTSMRAGADAGSRVLFYALEITTGSFLSGSVELKDRRVVAINPPALK